MFPMNFLHKIFIMKKILQYLSVYLTFYLILTVFSANANPDIDKFFPEIDEFIITNGIKIYYPDDLDDVINGAAEIYRDYKFRELAVATYEKQPDQLFAVEIYRFENQDYAFGVYSYERYGNASNFVDVGAHGYYESGTLCFCKDCYYVKIRGHELEDEESLFMDVAEKTASGLPGKNSFPPVFGEFPFLNRYENSERFIAANFLGYPFFNRVFTADFRSREIDFSGFTFFIMKRESKKECQDIIKSYMRYLNMDNVEVKEGKHKFDDPFYGTVEVDWKGKTVNGIYGLEDDEARARYLDFDIKEFTIDKKSTGIAYQKPASSSSVENNDLLPEYAFDGLLLTRWSSAWTDSSWISVDLGKDYLIDKVKLTWESAYATNYQILISTNGNDWIEVYHTENGDGDIDEIEFDPVTARFVRMLGISRATPYGFSLYEFHVFKAEK